VIFCDLREARGAAGACFAIASRLDFSLPGSDPVARTGHALAGRGRCLLVLDNVEQIAAEAAAMIGRWLARAPEVAFLVTSRERLGLPEERATPTPPLAPPPSGADRAALDEALALHRGAGDREGEVSDLAALGRLRLEAGARGDARARCCPRPRRRRRTSPSTPAPRSGERSTICAPNSRLDCATTSHNFTQPQARGNTADRPSGQEVE